ncbi:MAG: PepSY-associated TM helix domain-containing protein, partial [Vicinamibacterales bacterium]
MKHAGIRRILVVGHRWVGLLMAAPLIFTALTGSLLVFSNELEHVIAPRLYAKPRPGVPHLDMATLAESAASLAPPHTQLLGVQMFHNDQASLMLLPEADPQTGKLAIKSLADLPPEILVDPWTGAELARRRRGDLSEGLVNLLPFIFYAHYQVVPLTMPLTMIGVLVLGGVAVLWTVDC